jgi:hypothetical protein
MTEKGAEEVKAHKEKRDRQAVEQQEEKQQKTEKLNESAEIVTLESIGGKVWEKDGKTRVYFNSPAEKFNLDFGSKNKNFKANNAKVFYDVDSKEWNYEGASEFKDAMISKAKSMMGA